MKDFELSYRARKALMVHIGEEAGAEIANLINEMATEIQELRRTKVSVTKIVPGAVTETREFNEEPV
ncbi:MULTISPECIES: hypothetical protein [Crateriforma]|uniref:Uncharacterized protein n=1 Tax=Crateriforma conspicua TaxID=2527996 RepID=A0A5C5YCF1_9PLAN|nr:MULTISPECIES: hypothetical protein [Crateriforma]QDV61620.1 hypothetical protein Mal65_07460 [Crateriforma conspicua]TWT72131.1 hypothetical protein Pan14r_44480 [Crateriforma conspicua]TWU63000.1 hypothetical protein V7x_47370 [Crateriforma conspicua]